jgi:hypothetical protein
LATIAIICAELAEAPHAREARRFGLEVGGSVAAQARGLVRLGVGHPRLERFVDEESPDLLVRDVADELLDVHAAVAERAPLAVRFGDLGFEGNDAFEPWAKLVHARKSTPNRSR